MIEEVWHPHLEGLKENGKSRDERRKIDREYDVVVVPSDGGCISGSESDDSDWSIGWLEHHGPGFQSDNDSEDSFAVLVPCYVRGSRDQENNSKDKLLTSGNIPDIYAGETKTHVEQWFLSLQRT